MNWFPPLPPLPVILTFPRLAVRPRLLMPAHVVVIDIDLNVKKWGGLTSRGGRNIEGDVRDGDVTDCGSRHNVCGTFEFKLDTLGISDGCKECGKRYVVHGAERLLRERNPEICDVPSGYAAHSVGLWQLKLHRETPIRARRRCAKKVRTSAASWPPAPIIMSSAACTTCKENPNGFLYVASVYWELAKGSNASLCSVMITSRSDIVIELIIFDKSSAIRNIFDTKKTDLVDLSRECDLQNKGLEGTA